MSQKVINLSADLQKLQNEGFEIEIKDSYLLVHNVPYVNADRAICRGILVSKLTLVGDTTTTPEDHVIFFIGNHPHNNDGSIITAIQHTSQNQILAQGITVNHSFSNKPSGGYKDYYDKVTTYINIISSHAESLDPSVTAKTFKVIEADDTENVFNYLDTNSSRSEINIISSKLKELKIAIIGLGGTGSYILDLISKTPVKELHLFDEDILLQHNAFRTPGAVPIEKLNQHLKKVTYLQEIYSNMHKNIFPHDYNISSLNVKELYGMSFVFVCIDNSETKKILINELIERKIPFIDVGIGIQSVDDSLIGSVRTTICTSTKNEHVNSRISFSDEENNDYSQNIQIAELNALNAALAVIKWKKMCSFYHDQENEHHSVYDIGVNKIMNDEITS